MNNPVQAARPCPSCHKAPLVEATREKVFHPLGEAVPVVLRVSRCPACGAELINAEQRRENLERLRARKVKYGHLLLGEEIVALRKKYGLTQQAAAKVFGKGKIAFSRYENETSYPDQSTTKLLKQAIARPDLLKALADEEGVEIPLWQARCEDERKAKTVVLVAKQKDTAIDPAWDVRPKQAPRSRISWQEAMQQDLERTLQAGSATLAVNDDLPDVSAVAS